MNPPPFRRILMVCTGNICRSPMAAALLAARLGPELDCQIESAGVAALVGASAEATTLELLADRGVDLSDHRARQIDLGLARQFELILVMESWQMEWLHTHIPVVQGRVQRLGRWRDREIPDPYQQSREVFEMTLSCIEECLDDWRECCLLC